MSRARLQKAEVIVLKRLDYGEADRVITVYSRERGKFALIAKGVRRIASRKAGHVELFTHARMVLAEGRNLDVLTQVEMVDAFPRLRDDLVRTTYAYHLAELIDRFEHEDHASPATFQLLRDSLAALGEADDPSVIARYFELHYLSLIGYRPHLFDCALCGAPLEQGDAVFSPDAGGVVCAGCAPTVADGLPLDDAAFRVLRFLQTHEIPLALRLQLQGSTRGQIENALNGFVRHHLERDLRSVEFLHGLRRFARTMDLAPAGRTPADDAAGGSVGRPAVASADDHAPPARTAE